MPSDGWGDLAKFFRQAPDAVTDGLERGLVIEANEMMADAKEQTPVDTGTLRASGTVGTPDRSGSGVSVDLGFGGAASAYAVVQHEGVHLRQVVGTSKFLERPVLARAGELGSVLAREVNRELRKFDQ